MTFCASVKAEGVSGLAGWGGFRCADSAGRIGSPAVAGVVGLVADILGERASGKGREDELKRGSAGSRSRRGGRGRASKGRLRLVPLVPEDCDLVRDNARADFGRESAAPGPFAGALMILPVSLALLVRVDPGVVVLLRATFCCVWLASDMTSPCG